MKRKGKRGDVKLETPVQNSRVLRLHTDKTALLSLVREAWQGSTQGHHLQILTPCSVCPRASQPVAGILPFFHELQGKHWMSGRIRFGLHLSRTVRAAHSLAEIRSAGQRRAEPAYLSRRGEDKQPNTQEDPVSLNSVATPQDKEASLPLKLPQTPSAEKGLGKES